MPPQREKRASFFQTRSCRGGRQRNAHSPYQRALESPPHRRPSNTDIWGEICNQKENSSDWELLRVRSFLSVLSLDQLRVPPQQKPGCKDGVGFDEPYQ